MINTFEQKPGVIWVIHCDQGELQDYHFNTLSAALEFVNEILNEECYYSRGKMLGDLDLKALEDFGWKFTPLESGETIQELESWV